MVRVSPKNSARQLLDQKVLAIRYLDGRMASRIPQKPQHRETQADSRGLRVSNFFSNHFKNYSDLFNRIFWANSGLGLASAPDFWNVVHSGRVTVHRTGITGFGDHNKVFLKNKQTLETDQVILCTGWTDNLGFFDESTRVEWGLPSAADHDRKWEKLDAAGDKVVVEKLPFLGKNAPDTRANSSHTRPWRLYRRLISPKMAAKGDRSVFFPGQIHSVYTPLVAEMQALWGVAFLLDRLDVPSHEELEKEVSVWCAWTRRRYLHLKICS